jgi:hypothetical protein
MTVLLPSLLVGLCSLLGCNKGDEIQYDQVNAADDVLTVLVGEPALLDPVNTVVRSSTGEVEIGSAEVSPGGGPIGTDHAIVVIVFDDYQDLVDRVSVRTSSPGRGEDEYDLIQDSADEGYYKLTITSAGAANEQREDSLTVRLWQALDTTEE